MNQLQPNTPEPDPNYTALPDTAATEEESEEKPELSEMVSWLYVYGVL